jgi:hypothetical protein
MKELEVVVDFSVDQWPYLHPMMSKNATLPFLGSDSLELFEHNCKILPNSWLYKDTPVEYRFNSDGLRMDKDVADVVNNDYFLFSGTSFGMGIGINLEDTIPYKISKKLNMDFINFTGTTFSNKLQTLSFFNFLKTDLPLPKILVMDWSPIRAYSYMSNNKMLYYCGKHLAKEYSEQYRAFKLLKDTDTFLVESTINRNMIMATCKRLGIKYLEISLWKDEFTFENNLPLIDVDANKEDLNYTYGRDLRIDDNGVYHLGHPGVGIHNAAAEKILESL